LFSFSILIFFIIKKERAILIEFNNEKSSLLARTITESLKEAMLERDPSILKRVINSHNSIGGMKAAVFSNNGELVYGEFDYRIPKEAFTSPVEKTLKTDKSLIFLKPLLNEKRCQPCHTAKDMMRGVVAIEISNENLRKELDETVRRIVLFAIVVVGFSGLVLLFVLRRMVISPINLLKEGSLRLREGNLSHRIKVISKDELGSLAEAFNQMAEEIENAQKTLEDAVNRRTKELKVIAELSTNVFRADLQLNEIMARFVNSTVDDLGYSFCILSFLDRKNGLLFHKYKRGIENTSFLDKLSLESDNPIIKAFYEVKSIIEKAKNIGISDRYGYVAIIPIVSHHRSRCREINLCNRRDCPAFNSVDERCWLLKGVLCNSHRDFGPASNPYECIDCDAFPLIGVLIVGVDSEREKISIHSLEILTSEIASAVENYRLIERQRENIETLIKLHDIAVERFQYLSMEKLSESIVSSSMTLFSKFDASVLWLKKEDGRLYLTKASGIDENKIPSSISMDSQNSIVEAIKSDRIVEASDIVTSGLLKVLVVPLKLRDSVIGCLALFREKDLLINETERVMLTLFAAQAASSVSAARIYEELKDEKEFSDAIFNHAVSGIMVLDKEGRVLKINKAALEMLEVSPDEIMNKKIETVFPELKNMLSITTGSAEIEMKTKKEGIKTIGYINSYLFDKKGVQKGIIVIFRDITEIKKLQAEIRKKQHFEALGKVISGVAHEIRNPLFAVQSMTQILEREIESPQHQIFIQTMLKEIQRIKRLVDELLFYSRPSKLQIAEVPLEVLFEELKSYIKTKYPEVDLSISIPEPIILKVDKDRLIQVFRNLFDNAVDAKSKKINVVAEKRNKTVVISITDDGIGIKKSDLDKVFDLFFTTRKEGTGLGLAICRKIIEEHNGSIEIESTEGKGTTVRLIFRILN